MTANELIAAPTTERVAATDFQRDVYCVMGLPFDAVTLVQARAWRIRLLSSSGARVDGNTNIA